MAAQVYQGLLLASQVTELAVAVMRIADHAGVVGQPTWQILRTLEIFAAQMQPLLDAAASGDPERIQIMFFEPSGILATDATRKAVETYFNRQELRRALLNQLGDLAFARGLCRALVPGGRLLMDLGLAESIWPNAQAKSWMVVDGTTVLEERTHDFLNGRIDATWTFLRDGRTSTRTSSIRLYTRSPAWWPSRSPRSSSPRSTPRSAKKA